MQRFLHLTCVLITLTCLRLSAAEHPVIQLWPQGLPEGSRQYSKDEIKRMKARTTSERIDRLFARNERAICLFDTDAGPLAVILVGAMIVAGIDTVWSGQVAPASHGLAETDYRNQHPAIQLGKGEEMGRFKLGSTVILLAGPGALQWQDSCGENSSVQMGSAMGTIRLST